MNLYKIFKENNISGFIKLPESLTRKYDRKERCLLFLSMYVYEKDEFATLKPIRVTNSLYINYLIRKEKLKLANSVELEILEDFKKIEVEIRPHVAINASELVPEFIAYNNLVENNLVEKIEDNIYE